MLSLIMKILMCLMFVLCYSSTYNLKLANQPEREEKARFDYNKIFQMSMCVIITASVTCYLKDRRNVKNKNKHNADIHVNDSNNPIDMQLTQMIYKQQSQIKELYNKQCTELHSMMNVMIKKYTTDMQTELQKVQDNLDSRNASHNIEYASEKISRTIPIMQQLSEWQKKYTKYENELQTQMTYYAQEKVIALLDKYKQYEKSYSKRTSFHTIDNYIQHSMTNNTVLVTYGFQTGTCITRSLFNEGSEVYLWCRYIPSSYSTKILAIMNKVFIDEKTWNDIYNDVSYNHYHIYHIIDPLLENYKEHIYEYLMGDLEIRTYNNSCMLNLILYYIVITNESWHKDIFKENYLVTVYHAGFFTLIFYKYINDILRILLKPEYARFLPVDQKYSNTAFKIPSIWQEVSDSTVEQD